MAENRLLTVGFFRNYPYPDLLQQSQDGNGLWNNLKFIDLDKNPREEVDILLVLNHPKEAVSIRCRKGGKIILIQEPPYEVNDYFKLLIRHFDLSVSGFKELPVKNVAEPAGLPWHINRDYRTLKTFDLNQERRDKVSWITSANNLFEGHQIRLDFIDFLKAENYDFDLFGRGFNPIEDKFDGIAPYKYSIAAENYIDDDYFTEKIIDVFLAGSMPIYYGCQNVEKYFPPESFVSRIFGEDQTDG
jgi:hypothetical protein